MNESIRFLTQWLDSWLWAVLAASALVYLIFVVRFVTHWLLIYQVYTLTNLPKDIPVPKDVTIGIGFAIVTACVVITLSNLLRDPSIYGAIIAFATDLLVLLMAVAPLAMPLYFYRRARRDMEESSKREHGTTGNR